MTNLGFTVPPTERAHKYLAYRLSNSGVVAVQQAGYDLDQLRDERNEADYVFHFAMSQGAASAAVRLAEEVIDHLDAARQEPTRTQITDAMKTYERNVLRDVTWHP